MARRLARRATRRDPPRWRGRRALRRLARAIRGGDRVALRAVWQRWLDDPSPLLREIATDGPFGERPDSTSMLRDIALGRLPNPDDPRFGEVLAAALARPDHPVAEAAAALILDAPPATVDAVCADESAVLTAFCVEHRLLPADPAAQAVFLLRTGQDVPYPGPLADGYAAAGWERQGRLRSAAHTGLPAMVLGEDRSRITGLTPGEIVDLGAWYAARQDWPALWRLTLDVSPVSAVELAATFPADWTPDGPHERRLLEVLTRVSPDVMTPFQRFPLPVGFEPTAVAFAPDDSQAAFLDEGGRRSRIAFVDLPGLTIIAEHRWRDRWRGSDAGLLHLGETVIRTGTCPQRFTAAGPPEDVPFAEYDMFRLSSGTHRHGWTSAYGRTVHLGSYLDPDRPRTIDLDERRAGLRGFAVEPETGEFAIHDDRSTFYGRLLLFDRDGALLAEAPLDHLLPSSRPHLIFAGPGRLITIGYDGGLRLWQRHGENLGLAATVDSPRVYGVHGLAAVRKMVVEEFGEPWISAGSLRPARPAFELGRRRRLWTSPDGTWTATTIALHRLVVPAAVAALIDHPQAAASHADLAAVTAESDDHPAVRVVRACLEHRLIHK
ncbi:hypothetical protein Q0Z83_033490 [Actinoplanes sichuanensis]|nr:hypothetical protein Q0Z83_033490 [Actinoplanes sichuanensis]